MSEAEEEEKNCIFTILSSDFIESLKNTNISRSEFEFGQLFVYVCGGGGVIFNIQLSELW